MTDQEYHTVIEQTMANIEAVLDDFIDDIDCEMQAGVLSLTFNDGSKIIINKQTPLHQLWLATQHQAYHLDYKDGTWICNRSGKHLNELLNAACSEQAQKPIKLGDI